MLRRPIDVGIALVLTLFGITLLLGIYRLPRRTVLEPDIPAAMLPANGLYGVEYNDFYQLRYRWTNGNATLELPNPGQAPLLWSATLSAGADRQAALIFHSTNLSLPLTITAQPRRYLLIIPNAATGERFPLRLQGDAFTEPGGRLLGVLLGTQGLATLGPAIPPRALLLLFGACGIVLFLLLRQAGWRLLTTLQFGIVFVTLLALWQHAGLWRYALLGRILTMLLVGGVAALLLARWLAKQPPLTYAQRSAQRPWQSSTTSHLLLLLALFLLTRLPLVGLPDRVGDLELFARWSAAANQQGLGGAYAVGSDYPPGTLYLLSGLGWLAAAWDLSLVTPLSYRASLLVKSVALLADAALVILIYCWMCRWRSPRQALLLTLLYMLTPPVLINAAWWGQIDALLMLCLVASFTLHDSWSGRWSWILWGLALLIKPQGILLLPILAPLTLRRWGLSTLINNILLALASFGLGLLPMVLSGLGPQTYAVYQGSVGHYPYPTLRAYNIWYLLTGGAGDLGDPAITVPTPRDDSIWLLGLTYRQVGLLLLVLAVVCIAWRTMRRPTLARASMAFALTTLAFFLLPTQIHERYMYFSFAPLALAMAFDQRLVYAYGALALANTFNLLRALSFIPAVQETLVAPFWAFAIASLTATIFGLLLWFFWQGYMTSDVEISAQT